MANSMEHVWKDISLSSLHRQPSRRDRDSNTTATLSSLILQDLFPQSFVRDNQHRAISANHDSPELPPLPTTVLTLTSGSDELGSFGNSSSQHPSQDSGFQPRALSGVGLDSNVKEKKRCRNTISDSADRRQKRMIKNRESAARSRARKQVYTGGLEMEVNNLMKENNSLKEQQKQLFLAAAADQLLKKPTLRRTSTAPF